jgi:serine/threonine protein kinase
MAPEVKGAPGERVAVYTERCDVFSFGVVLYELLLPSGRFVTPPGVSRKAPFARGFRPMLALPPDRKAFEPIIAWCWQQEPAHRPTMSHVVTTCLRDACLEHSQGLRGDLY